MNNFAFPLAGDNASGRLVGARPAHSGDMSASINTRDRAASPTRAGQKRRASPRPSTSDDDRAESEADRKPKACLPCRKSKIKCARDRGQADCRRCMAKGQECTFADRTSSTELLLSLADHVEAGSAHVAHLTQVVQTLLDQLRQHGIPTTVHLSEYSAPAIRSTTENRSKRKSTPPLRDINESEQDTLTGLLSFPTQGAQGLQSAHAQPGHGTQSDRLQIDHIVSGGTDTSQAPIDPGGGFDMPLGLEPFGPPPVSNSRPFFMPPPLPPQAQPPMPNLAPWQPTTQFAPTQTAQTTTTTQTTPQQSRADFQHDLFDFGPKTKDSGANTFPMGAEGAELGSEDARPNLISKGIISNSTAQHLVSFFHERLSPFLFGYPLGFGKIPYSPNGPKTMTPFIMSVLCLAASKRSTEYKQHVGVLDGEVSDLLRQCTLTGNVFGFDDIATESMGEIWDPELGIGPEEVVGAAVLALFSDDRKDARVTAATALKWAEGLIKWTKEGARSYTTIGEVVGLLQPPRAMEDADMARLWLLCYIVNSTESIQGSEARDEGPSPEPTCTQLLDERGDGSSSPSRPEGNTRQADNELVFQARILHILRVWRARRSRLDTSEQAKQRRLTNETLQRLDHCHAEFEDSVGDSPSRLALFGYAAARCFVNHLWVKSASHGANGKLLRSTQEATLIEATEVLEHCASWKPVEDIGKLPEWYLMLIRFAASVIQDLTQSSDMAVPGQDGSSGRKGLMSARESIQQCLRAFEITRLRTPSVEAIIGILKSCNP